MVLLAYYLLKVTLVSGLLFAWYLIALRNKRFHQYNRFYLLFVVALSLIIPLIKIQFWKETVQQEMPVIRLLKVVARQDAFVQDSLRFAFVPWILNNMFLVNFSLISVTFLTLVIIGIMKIGILIRSNPNRSWNKVNFIFTEAKGTPFSFFKYIFWNKNIDLQTEEGKLILKHELIHVHEKHSADKLFIQFALIIAWLNPFFWLVRKELSMIHEFIADEKAVSDGDVNSFSAMLLKTAYPQHSFATLTNSFFHSPIKRRLIMFTTSKNSRHSYLRRLMILPLLSFVIVLFVFKSKGQISTSDNNTDKASKNKFEKVVTANEIIKSNIAPGEVTDSVSEKSLDTAITNKLIALAEIHVRLKNQYKQDKTLNEQIDFLLEKLASEKSLGKPANLEVIKFLEDVIVKKIDEERKEKSTTALHNLNDAIATKPEEFSNKNSDTIEAKFPGGDLAWKKYLETNLDANVPVSKDKAPSGDYTVKLEFIVTETGEINSISASKVPEHCPSCAIEAVRIIKKGPKWDPMTIDGKKITSKQVQFISFRVEKN